MALSKTFLVRVAREAEKQGATVTWGKKGLRVKGVNGLVIIVHKTPSRPEVYRLSLVQDLRRVGVEAPGGQWK